MNHTIRVTLAPVRDLRRRTRRRLPTVSRIAAGSGETIARLKEAVPSRLGARRGAFQYRSERWADDQEWPIGIPRPQAVLATEMSRDDHEG